MTTPAAAQRSCVAGGSSSCQETSVVRSRGATSRPRSASIPASVSASVAARSMHVVPVRRGEHDERRRGGDRDLEALRARVVARGAGGRDGVQARARVREVHVRRADREQALGPVRRHPQQARADRPAEPLLARARVEVAAERRRRRPATAPTPCAPSSRTGTSSPDRSGARRPSIQLTCERRDELASRA